MTEDPEATEHLFRDPERGPKANGILPEAQITLRHRLHRFFVSHRPFGRMTLRLFPRVRAVIRGARFLLAPYGNYSESIAWRTGDLKELRSLSHLLELMDGRKAFIVDIGANCGFFTVFFSLYARSGSRIQAFEPNPQMARLLEENLRLNPAGRPVEIHEVALSDGKTDGSVLYVPTQNLGAASLIRPSGTVRPIAVPVRTLASVLVEAAADMYVVVKIDVEGHEPHILMPLLEASDARLPDAFLIETDNLDKWQVDLLHALEKRGFRSVFEGEQNSLFLRSVSAGEKAH